MPEVTVTLNVASRELPAEEIRKVAVGNPVRPDSMSKDTPVGGDDEYCRLIVATAWPNLTSSSARTTSLPVTSAETSDARDDNNTRIAAVTVVALSNLAEYPTSKLGLVDKLTRRETSPK